MKFSVSPTSATSANPTFPIKRHILSRMIDNNDDGSKATNVDHEQIQVPENLFHTILTASRDDNEHQGPGSRVIYPLASHATLDAAKAFALKALPLLGYSHFNFESVYERQSRDTAEESSTLLEDGIMVHARRPGAHDFLVSIITAPNNEKLPAKADGHGDLALPSGISHLYYIMQTRIDYNADRTGAFQDTTIEGTYVRKADAVAAAKKCLISDEKDKGDFEVYEERDGYKIGEDWPYGEEVLVHAVAGTGENFEVAVMTPLLAHERHKKR